MYAARPEIQRRTGKQLQTAYFTQTLLPDYVERHDCADWDVVFDPRGHFTEPHTGRSIGVGTVKVRNYLNEMRPPIIKQPGFAAGKVSTRGPKGRYGRVMFTEKEGFDPLFDHAKLKDRFDVASLSTKGLSVTAARWLIDVVCGAGKIPLLVLHDFDKAGFSIFGTFRRATRRFTFKYNPQVIDIGLRMRDAIDLGLIDDAEDVFDSDSEDARLANMLENGATVEEARFLLTKRVELHALTSRQLIDLIERKFRQIGVANVVPADDQLAESISNVQQNRSSQSDHRKAHGR
jgi:hypothetical protein